MATNHVARLPLLCSNSFCDDSFSIETLVAVKVKNGPSNNQEHLYD